MPDFATWALVDALTVEQAACLWAGAEPTESRFQRPKALEDQVAAIKQMLTAAIRSGVLKADTSANPLEMIGDHSNSLLTREGLQVFAESKNQRPSFLFDTLLPPKTKQVDDSSVDDTASPSSRARRGRPPEYDWDKFVIEIIRIADLDGLPGKQSELKERMLQWCEDTWGKQPAESAVKRRISDIYNGLGRGQKTRT